MNQFYINILSKNLVYAFISLNLFIASTIFESEFGLPSILKYIFSLYALYQIVLYKIKLPKNTSDGVFVELCRLFFALVSITLLIGSIRFEVFYLQELMGEQFFFLPFLTPVLFLYSDYNLILFKYLIKATYYLLIFAIIIQVFIIANTLNDLYYVQNIVSILTFSLFPLLLSGTSHLNPRKYSWLIPLVYFLLFAFICAMLGRRGETLEPLFMIMWSFIIRLSSNKLNFGIKVKYFITGLIFFIISFYIIMAYKDQIYLFERGLSKEGFDESRGETVDNFLADFGSQPNDYLWGRGLNGTFQKFNFGENAISRSIEIGYFNVMLKGGLLYTLPMMFLLVVGFVKGFYFSNNDLVKCLSGLLLWQIIYMASFGMANYNTTYSLIWISAAICLNPYLRALDNESVQENLF